MKAFALPGSPKTLPRTIGGHKKGAHPKTYTPFEIDRGPVELQNHKAALVGGGYTEVESYRDGSGKRKFRRLKVTSLTPLEFSEYALGIMFAHHAISSQEMRAGDLWAIGRARDARSSVYPRTPFYEEHIRGGHDGAVQEEDEITKSIWTYRKGRKMLREMGQRVFSQVWGAAVESRLPAWFIRQRGLVVRGADPVDRQAFHGGLELLVELYEVS